MTEFNQTIARKGNIIAKTGFQGYDYCLNPYVGCQHGCKYCYVRFFIKDKNHPWGQFIRTRDHIQTKLHEELTKLPPNSRIVIGTMTDPYQPQEEIHRLTQKTLQIIQQTKNKPQKIGIFTKSPRILQDAQLIETLPDPTIHLTLSPFPQEILQLLETDVQSLEERKKAIRELTKRKIKICLNIAPAIPIISDQLTSSLINFIQEIQPTQFFVDSLQKYQESYLNVKTALKHLPIWPQIEKQLEDEPFLKWKASFAHQWITEIKSIKYQGIPIWCDHASQTWINMHTGQDIPKKNHDW